jgi:hypothetical protein
MKPKPIFMNAKVLTQFAALLALSAGVAFAQTTSKRKSTTSKFYVAEVKGFSQVNTGEKIEDLTEKSVFDAEGTVIETKQIEPAAAAADGRQQPPGRGGDQQQHEQADHIHREAGLAAEAHPQRPASTHRRLTHPAVIVFWM